jgi:hypothetical protein
MIRFRTIFQVALAATVLSIPAPSLLDIPPGSTRLYQRAGMIVVSEFAL